MIITVDIFHYKGNSGAISRLIIKLMKWKVIFCTNSFFYERRKHCLSGFSFQYRCKPMWLFHKKYYMQWIGSLISWLPVFQLRAIELILSIYWCLSGFVKATSCTSSTVQSYTVHLWPALCTTDMCCALRTEVMCWCLYWLGGVHDNLSCSLWTTT